MADRMEGWMERGKVEETRIQESRTEQSEQQIPEKQAREDADAPSPFSFVTASLNHGAQAPLFILGW